jgi:hypothetical protein
MARTAVVAKKPSTSVISFEDQLQKFKERLASVGGDRIIPENHLFKLPNGDKAETIRAVIVDFIHANYFYENGYVEGTRNSPVCFSLSPTPKTMKPSTNSTDPQDDACATCPQNQFGSAGKGKACKNSVLLALLPVDASHEDNLMILSVSPTGLKSFNHYISAVVRSGLPPYAVSTEIRCDEDLKYDSLRFGFPEPLNKAQLEAITARIPEAAERLAQEPEIVEEKPEVAPARARKGVKK